MPAARRIAKTKPTSPDNTIGGAANDAPLLVDAVTAPVEKVGVLRAILFSQIEREVKSGNVRVILWLADRIRLVDTPEDRASPNDELRSLLDDLSSEELREFVSLGDK
ncbi:MAG: hypothetical protein EA356_06140 [Geminicoccaceae bacterium]|nr:MAG: hypothetical protein EA356_06140 [Geminicoccaceae bacterium]